MKLAFKITNIVMLAGTLIYMLAIAAITVFYSGDILSLLFALLPITFTILMNIRGINGNYKSCVTLSVVIFFMYLLTLIFADNFILAILRIGIIIAYLCFANFMKKKAQEELAAD